MKEGVDPGAEEKTHPQQEGSRQDYFSRSNPVDQASDDRGRHHVGEHGDGLSPGCFRTAPMEMVDKGDEE